MYKIFCLIDYNCLTGAMNNFVPMLRIILTLSLDLNYKSGYIINVLAA